MRGGPEKVKLTSGTALTTGAEYSSSGAQLFHFFMWGGNSRDMRWPVCSTEAHECSTGVHECSTEAHAVQRDVQQVPDGESRDIR